MALDIFFLEDIRNALAAADEASSATAEIAASNQPDNGWCTHVPIVLELGEERFRCDICNKAWSIGDVKEMLRHSDHRHALRDYRRGYRAALTTVALAFGLPPAVIGGDAAKLPCREDA